MESNKKLVLGIFAIVAFLYAVSTVAVLLSNASNTDFCPASGTEDCPHKQELDFLVGALPLIASIAIVAGAGAYYLMAGKVEGKQKAAKSTAEVLLKFLNPDERKLVNLLIENDGKVLQAELTRLPGMSKVKSHRIVQRLMDRGVIEKDSLGKTNIVGFTKEIKEGLM